MKKRGSGPSILSVDSTCYTRQSIANSEITFAGEYILADIKF